jgi:hypothetical protein
MKAEMRLAASVKCLPFDDLQMQAINSINQQQKHKLAG